MSPRRHSTARGFTLVELLVSMSIFVTIMAGVFLMFNSAVRVTKQAYLNQAAYETVRGTFDTIEADLIRSFTSRDTGHKHTFYGTPIGFTFIGMVSPDNDGDNNLARITYVIYGGTNPELTQLLESTADDDTAPEDRTTYSLIRYIEPGVDDLESFPIDWNSSFFLDAGTVDLQQQINNAQALANGEGLCNTPECFEEVAKAKKRELWIRMLAGGDQSDPLAPIPNFWTVPQVRSGGLQTAFLDPADYILAENILHIERAIPFNPRDNATYNVVNTDPFATGTNHFIDPLGEDIALIPMTTAGSDATDTTSIQNYLFANFARNVVPHQNYFFAYREYAEGNRTALDAFGSVFDVPKVDAEGNSTGVIESEFDAYHFSFWNDTRNLEHNNILTNANLIVNTLPADSVGVLSTKPDIIDPTIPESILIELAFFHKSPYPGAPDFQRIFTHRVNLPTAYKRKQETLQSKQVRQD